MEKKEVSKNGVGIGLLLVRLLAPLHKGIPALDTIRERDNVFILTISLNKEGISLKNSKVVQKDIVGLDEETPVETDMHGYTLLLVKDNESMLVSISERLCECFIVETTKNDAEAIEVLRNNRVDLITSDIMMPVMNNYQLCKEIKSDLELSHIPIIFLTVKDDVDSKINGLKYGAEAHVEKPFLSGYLKEQILSLLSDRRWEREAFPERPFFSVDNMQMNKADEEFINKVIRTIEDNITDDNFGVERIADILCMSRSSLLRKIKTIFNLSPLDFIRLIRLRKAAEYTQEGKYRIGDIRYAAGINSLPYFSKLSLKRSGMTPEDFKKQHQSGKQTVTPQDIRNMNTINDVDKQKICGFREIVKHIAVNLSFFDLSTPSHTSGNAYFWGTLLLYLKPCPLCHMRNRFRQFKIIFGTMPLLFTLSGYTVGYKSLTTGGQQIRFDDQKGGASLYKKSKNICEGLYASYPWGEQTVITRDYACHKVSIRKISDAFGKGILYKIEHTDKSLPKLTQYSYLYPGKEYISTEFSIEGKNNVASNWMVSVNVDHMAELLPVSGNRALFMPFDNNKQIRYQSHALNFDILTSYEVTAVFNNERRSGLAIGSVEHDNWKTAVMLGKGDHRNIDSSTCYGGVVDELTRDVKPYGALKGKKIKSPKMLLRFSENWCDGLETCVKVNTIISPPKKQGKAVPFGRDSWGAL